MPIYDPHFNTTPPMPVAALVPSPGGASVPGVPTGRLTSNPSDSGGHRIKVTINSGFDAFAGSAQTMDYNERVPSLREAAAKLRSIAEEIEYLSSKRESS